MKANEAPEKLYVNFHFIETHPESHQPLVTKQGINKYDIEYIRKDAFIEKVVDYICEHVEYYMKKDKMCNIPVCPLFEKQSFIEGFRKHMKGE